MHPQNIHQENPDSKYSWNRQKAHESEASMAMKKAQSSKLSKTENSKKSKKNRVFFENFENFRFVFKEATKKSTSRQFFKKSLYTALEHALEVSRTDF